jgi:hypothetical protein
MINTARSALFILVLCASHHLHGENIITFFIRPYHTTDDITHEEFREVLQEPGKLARQLLKTLVEVGHFQGVIASYMGYITVSDFSGQIIFPRMHQAPELNLLITPMVEPVMMLGATVHHLALLNALPAQMYRISRKQDAETEIYYWDIQLVELPASKRIALDTIILFTKPDNIIVPTGITITDDSPMLKLPDMYATKELNVAMEALRVLKIRHFFGPVQFNYIKQTDLDYAKQLVR